LQSLFQKLEPGSRVLFIRLRNLGEAILDTANLRALKRYRPDLEITTLVEAPYTGLYAADADIHAVGLKREAGERRSSLTARLSMISQIRKQRFTAVVNLHGGPASAQLTWLSGARHRIGASHFRHGYAYNLRVPPAEEILGRTDLHTVESQFAWFKWLGLPAEEPGPTSLAVVEAARATARAKLAQSGINPRQPYSVIAPTNEFYTKRWMPDRYARIAESLAARGLQVVLTGAPTAEQIEQLESVQAATAQRLSCVSSLNIAELVAAISESRIFVGNDSGPAHMAAALRVPLVVLFGPASSVRWRPWQANAELVQNYFACNPCAMYTCTAFAEPECIRSITIDQVEKAIDSLLVKALIKQ